MAAGVPIKAPVAGIAMGLITDGEDYTILTDTINNILIRMINNYTTIIF